jgi:tetratricopeptide (TPR) repeat protein
LQTALARRDATRTQIALSCGGLNAWATANAVFGEWQIEMLAGKPERAAAAARESLSIFGAMGAKNEGSTAAALLAVALAVQGRHDEAIRYADLAASWAAPDDIASQVGQLTARAHVLAARDDLPGALAAVREAVLSSEGSDDISQRGDALVDLATILMQAGQADQALTALRDAIALYDRKGNVVGAERAQAILRPLAAGASVSDA